MPKASISLRGRRLAKARLLHSKDLIFELRFVCILFSVKKNIELGFTLGIDVQSFTGLIMVDPNKLASYDSNNHEDVMPVTLERGDHGPL